MRDAREFDPVSGPSPEFEGEDVVVILDSQGGAAILPSSLRSLPEDVRASTSHVLRLAGQIHELQAELGETVLELRDRGVPWSGVGWLTGMSGEGARKRWGSSER